jgi:DNA-directed RNA polymerase specialized sigma24 family protein
VEARTSFKKDWVLSQDAFDALLKRLDPDRERAAVQYEHIRRALIMFFESRGSSTADEHADTTINRAARRLIEGKEIHVENPVSYFYGVARNVLKESWDALARNRSGLAGALEARVSVDPQAERELWLERQRRESRLECLDGCLRGLTAEHRDLIAAYYQGEAGAKVENRQRLADRIGIPINALRIRALRIRERLEDCVGRCMERQPS